jgi:hypothetical protein
MADADDLAISALGWLAAKPDLMGRFMALSGLTADSLRGASTEPGFLAGVLGFLMNHEPTLMDFCVDTGTAPAAVADAYRALAPDAGHGYEA